jgi:hypothetical protein
LVEFDHRLAEAEDIEAHLCSGAGLQFSGIVLCRVQR